MRYSWRLGGGLLPAAAILLQGCATPVGVRNLNLKEIL